jgi:hypothetical protein
MRVDNSEVDSLVFVAVIDTGYSSSLSATASSFIHLPLSTMYLAQLPLIRIIAHLLLHFVPEPSVVTLYIHF